jgi:hypothetical protein
MILVFCTNASCTLIAAYPEPGEELTQASCQNGLDDDEDGLMDCQSLACRELGVCDEHTMDTCTDGLDDDGDGRIDRFDPSCFHLVPPVLERCATIAGTALDPEAPVERLGWIGPVSYADGAASHAGRDVITMGEDAVIVALSPWTGRMSTLRFSADVFFEPDGRSASSVVLRVVDAATVDPATGWSGRGDLVAVGLNELSVLVGHAEASRSTPVPFSTSGWAHVELSFAVIDGVVSATVTHTHPDDPTALPRTLTLALEEDLELPAAAQLVVTFDHEGDEGAMQLDRVAATAEAIERCGATIPSPGVVRAMLGSAEIEGRICAILRDGEGRAIPSYSDDGGASFTELDAIEGVSSPIVIALAPHADGVAGVLAEGIPGGSNADEIVALRELRASAECDSWTVGPAEAPPSVIRAYDMALATEGELLVATHAVGGPSTQLARLRREEGQWVLLERTTLEPIRSRIVASFAALGEELVLVTWTTSGTQEMVVRTARGEWLPPLPWLAPSREHGTFDYASIGPGHLNLRPEGVLYHYASLPPPWCRDCPFGLVRQR